uniref:Uncharacterized protein n=1 Tax=Rhizophora mucronata TaxID=61149 RepID=A0A2P2K5H9_RHIMU
MLFLRVFRHTVWREIE